MLCEKNILGKRGWNLNVLMFTSRLLICFFNLNCLETTRYNSFSSKSWCFYEMVFLMRLKVVFLSVFVLIALKLIATTIFGSKCLMRNMQISWFFFQATGIPRTCCSTDPGSCQSFLQKRNPKRNPATPTRWRRLEITNFFVLIRHFYRSYIFC